VRRDVSGADGDRKHHIASVAHHFLAGGGEPGARAPAAAVVVAAAEPLPLTAFVAAGAARSAALAGRRRWGLLEDDAAVWSAATHLADDGWVHRLPAAGFERLRQPERGLCWHLGGIGDAGLDAWAAVGDLPGCALPTAGRTSRLLWCVAAEAAGQLAALGPLARLVDLLAPATVDVVVAPRTWPHRRAAKGAAGPLVDSALGRLQERAAAVSARPARVGCVTGDMNAPAAAAIVTDLLRRPADS